VSLARLHKDASKASTKILHRDPSKDAILKQRQNLSKLQLNDDLKLQNQSKSDLKLNFLKSDDQSIGRPMDVKQVDQLRQSKDQMRMSKELGRTHDHNLRVSKDEPLQAIRDD
jgi:hypothetical protein